MSGPASTNSNKFKEAVHFVCKKMALEPQKLGAIKLQKIIWYFDIRSLSMTGKPATGATFIKNTHGPYTREMQGIISQLVSEGRLHTDTEDYFGNEKARFIGKGSTDLSVLSEREQRWLEEIAKDICENHTADSISERTHGAIWKMAEFGEPIPFLAAAIQVKKPSVDAVEFFKKEFGIA